jgi:capsular polysaccharide biosynthesis protein
MESNNKNALNVENEIDLGEFFGVLWGGKWLIASVTSLFSIAAVIYSLSLPNLYQSTALLSSVESSSGNGLNQAMKSYSGLASLAGVNLPGNTSGSNSVKATQKLKTLSFFKKNILPNIYLPDLMAIESWDINTNTLIYNKEIFNNETQTWVRDFQFPLTQTPSAQESHKAFMHHLSVTTDIDTGFISISVIHQSPFIAKTWTDLVIKQLNDFFRVKDKIEAQAALDYLNLQISQTSFSEIKLVIAELMQQKMQQLTLIEANNFYVFEYIDPPEVMETKISPVRAQICILGAFIGVILSCLIVLIRFYIFNTKV